MANGRCPSRLSTALSRRRLLQAATALAVNLSAPAILGRTAAQVGASDTVRLRGGEILPDPDFSLLRPTDPYLIGIRSHREGGVRLELEQEPIASPWGPKFLIHNYGHGGAGITLSFGCASIVADHVRTLLRHMGPRRHISVAVIGSGVIGLTVASELRRQWPRLGIAVYAKELDVRRRTALQDAASVVGLPITTEAMAAEAPKKQPQTPAMPGGGMGGMDY